MRVLVFSALLVSLIQGVFIKENVIFQKTNDITTSRAKWLATFVIDLRPFDRFLSKLASDISLAETTADAIISKYKSDDHLEYLNIFKALRKEVTYLNATQNMITRNFLDLKSLRKANRGKRSLIPIVGKAFSWLFGLTTESDLENIKENVNILSKNQQRVIHVVEQSISVLNLSRVEIKENRHKIIELTKGLHQMDSNLKRISKALETEIYHTKLFLDLYLKLQLVIAEIHQLLQSALYYILHVQNQINFLSFGHLSTEIIRPHDLRSLLMQIKTLLPPMLSLIGDPMTDLFLFFRNLECVAIPDDQQILITIYIPLLRLDSVFEVFAIYSLHLPYIPTANFIIPDKQDRNMHDLNLVASYQVESNAMMINKARTKYALLDHDEFEKCSHSKWCTTKSPVYPVNLAKLCLISLFLMNNDAVEKNCEVTVTLDRKLPMGITLFSNQWAIVTRENLTFTTDCSSKNQEGSRLIRPPLGIMHVPNMCTASNKYMTLTSASVRKSQVAITDQDFQLLRNYNVTRPMLWRRFERHFPNLTQVQIPKTLKEVKEISLQGLLYELNSMQSLQVKKNQWSIWLYVGAVSIVLIILSLIALCLYKKGYMRCRKIPYSAHSMQGRKEVISQPRESIEMQTTLVSTEATPRSSRNPNLPVSSKDTLDTIVKMIYPSLSKENVTEVTSL